MRSSRSANVRRRESHSGHSHPTNSAAVSKTCARSRARSRPKPAGRPSRRTTAMPNNARPRLHPVRSGASERFSAISRTIRPAATVDAHHSQLWNGAVNHATRTRHHRQAEQHIDRKRPGPRPPGRNGLVSTSSVTDSGSASCRTTDERSREEETSTVKSSPGRASRSCTARPRASSPRASAAQFPGSGSPGWTAP